MPLQTVLIKPASGACSMHCDYCFYCDEIEKRKTKSFGMMSEETVRNVIRKTIAQAEGQLCFAFQGGEPTLRGLDFFREVLRYEAMYNVRNLPILNTIQTNGLGLDEEWCRFLGENHFLVGVSVDGTREIHDRYRHDHRGGATYDRIVEHTKLLERYHVEYNILTVVTREIAENIGQIYRDYKAHGWRYQQYIKCLDPLEEKKGTRDYSLTPELYGRFLIELFRLWYRDWRRGKAPYIRQFENYIGILLGERPESCEQTGICSIQCVTEADGSTYPCDFYVLDQYRLGNFNSNRVREFFEHPMAKQFVADSLQISPACKVCPDYDLCRGACRRSRVQEADGTWRSYFCKSYQMFFRACRPQMEEIAAFLLKQQRPGR